MRNVFMDLIKGLPVAELSNLLLFHSSTFKSVCKALYDIFEINLMVNLCIVKVPVGEAQILGIRGYDSNLGKRFSMVAALDLHETLLWWEVCDLEPGGLVFGYGLELSL